MKAFLRGSNEISISAKKFQTKFVDMMETRVLCPLFL